MIIFLSTYFAYGVPASPEPFIYMQPDGTQLTLYTAGDEYYNWVETEEKEIVIENNGRYEYATIMNGEIVASGIYVSKQTDSKQDTILSKRHEIIDLMLRKRERTIAAMDSINNTRNLTTGPLTTGNQKVLCILIGFPDKPFSQAKSNYVNMWNQVGYNDNGSQGSVRDFYTENSYGNIFIETTVLGPYTASHNSSYYDTGSGSGTISSSNVRELISEALIAARNEILFQNFDVNGDNYVDAVHVIFAGYGKESGSNGVIWSHRWSLSTPIVQNGYYAQDYFCTPELAGNSGSTVAPIGTICHEYGHILGAPDYYDLNDSGFKGTGHWDVMCNGSWNHGGRCPAHHNPYTKAYIYHWATPMTINSFVSNTTYTLPPSHSINCFYRINTSTIGEFYLLENKKRLGFNSYVGGVNKDGLLIYHIHKNIQQAIANNTVNTAHPQKCYIVNANATTNPNSSPSSYGSDDTQWAYPTNNQRFFTLSSIPTACSWAGSPTGVNICFIKKVGNNIQFVVNPQIIGPSVLDSLETYSIANMTNDAQIKWTYTANVEPSSPATQYLYHPITFEGGDSTASVSVKRGKYKTYIIVHDSFPPIIREKSEKGTYPIWLFYEGTITLKATISSGDDSYIISKTITLPEEERISHEFVQVDNLDISENSPLSLQYSMVHPNPIIGNNIIIGVRQLIEDVMVPINDAYTIELWDNKYGLIQRRDYISPDIEFEIGSLPIGLYHLILIVNGKVRTTSKIIKL